MIIKHASGISGASSASGPTVVIDVFRAYSAAAYAFAAGATQIVLAADVDEARQLATGIDGSVLMGEVDGVRPEGFALGNSPGELEASPHLVHGRTIIHRSSAGTRCARAALDNGASPLYVASLVVASATAAAIADFPEVTLVASGLSGVGPALEDDICAGVLTDLLLGGDADLAAGAEAVAATDRAKLLKTASFAHPSDVRLCSAVDRFDFAMMATVTADGVAIHKV
ncbi:MAG: 2-phosphosulfolactate phosphatase [Acidimicrobiia bacterium]|nr:2-phosphosulfolactate phosphatase [Acidimicrobiia bacterium]MDX2468154.1 2-phosphosulfolactate phosphatase [Acidimicrobiia bacterium]